MVSDDYADRIWELRNEMNQWTRKGVVNEIRHEDRLKGIQIFTICDLHDKRKQCDLDAIDMKKPRKAAELITSYFMDLTGMYTSEAWHADCSTFTANEGPKLHYARRPFQMDILYKTDKELWELRLQLLSMNRNQIQALYEHMAETEVSRLWLIADSIHRRPAPGLLWGENIKIWLTSELGFTQYRDETGDTSVYQNPSDGNIIVAVYCDHIAWNGSDTSKRWFQEQYFKKCTGATSYEWNSYTSVEIDFTTGNCCIEFDQPKVRYGGYHNNYRYHH